MASNKKLILTLGVAAGTAVVGALALAYRSGVFASAEVVNGSLVPMKLLYTRFEGNYDNLKPVYDQLTQKAKDLNIPNDNMQFVTIRYNNPDKEGQDRNKCVAVVGVCVSLVDERFLEKYRQGQDAQYKIVDLLGSSTGIQCQWKVSCCGFKGAIKKSQQALLKKLQEAKKEIDPVIVTVTDTRPSAKNFYVIIPYDNIPFYKGLSK